MQKAECRIQNVEARGEDWQSWVRAAVGGTLRLTHDASRTGRAGWRGREVKRHGGGLTPLGGHGTLDL